MNFQGPRDFTPYVRQYQRIMTFLLYIQSDYPEVYETLLQSPQFEYEFEACKFKKKRARAYLSNLRSLVVEYERAHQSVIVEIKLQEEPVPMLEWRRY